MKLKIFSLIFIAIIAGAFVAAGCGAGKDASFSPDPSVADLFGGDGSPDDPVGDGDVDVEGDKDQELPETDCFEDGFCYRTCDAVSDCPDGFSCIMHVCTFDCQSDDECGTGGRCNEVGLCEVVHGEEIPDCTSDSECGDGRFCNSDGDCEQIPVILGCQNDADCPTGQYCNDAHSCELFPLAGVECVADDECPGNYYCDDSGQCAQECRSDYQCADGKACNDIGRCVTPGVPVRLKSFSFSTLGADTDPAGPITFESTNFKIDQAVITPAGRNQVLTSPRFRLTGSAAF